MTPRSLALSSSSAAVALALLACSSAPPASDEPTATASQAMCVVKPHCGACQPDDEETCWACDGSTYTQPCRYRTCRYHVTNVAGSHLWNPAIVRVYWGAYFNEGWGGLANTLAHENVWDALSVSNEFWTRMNEYSISVGRNGGLGGAEPSLGATVADGDIQSYLSSEMDSGAVPTPSGDVIYVVYLPPGSRSQWNVGSTSTAYHSSFVKNGTRYAYAVMDPSGDSATIDLVASHEVAEAATDTNIFCGANTGCGWNVAGMSGGEIADLCAPGTETIAGYSVALVWSQAACACK